MEWSWHDPRVWAALVIVLQFVAIAFQWLGRKEFASPKQVEDAHQRADDAHHRINLIEKDLKGLPGYEVTNDLREKLARVEVNVEAMKAEVRGIDDKVERTESAVTRIEQHLLTAAR